MRVTYQVGSREVVANVARSPDGLTIELGGASHRIEPIAVSGDAVTFRLDGRPVTALVAALRDEIVVALPRVTVHLGRGRSVPRAGAGGRGPGAGGKQDIEAPMAGRVLRILVEEGSVVTAGEVVLILEAMKTETEVRAERGGVLRQVRVTPGEVVAPGQVLLVLGEAADGGGGAAVSA